MKKLRLLMAAVLSVMCLGAFAQTTADLGTDWDAGSSAFINAESGIALAENQLEYTVNQGQEDEFIVSVVGGSVPKRDSKSVYASPMPGNITYLYLSGATEFNYIAGKVTGNKKITGVQLNGTSASVDFEVTGAILYSDKAEFDATNVTGYAAFNLAACRSGNAGVQIADMPAGTKSFRIYRSVYLSGTEGNYTVTETKISDPEKPAGEIQVGGKMESVEGTVTGLVRVAYVKVTMEDGAPAAEPTLALTSDETTTKQTLFSGVAITPITYRFGGTATSASVTWDNTPDGITVATEGDIVTISGTIAAAGTYTYSITATDGEKNVGPLTGTITATGVTKPLIAYVTSDSPATDAGDIAIIAKLSDAYEIVTISATTSGVDYSGYAAIVMSGVPKSASVGLAELENFTKPFVNLKTWMFKSTLWNWGESDNLAENLGETTLVNNVIVNNASHPIFEGMGLSDGSQITMATASSHAGGLRVLIPVLSWNEGNEANVTTLASVTGSNTGNDGKVVIGEIAVGSTMSGAAINHKNVFIGVSEAAGQYLTADYLTIVKNAVDYVIDDDESIDSEKADDAAKVEVAAEYYDLMGRAISGAPKGIVIKKSIYEDGSFSFGKAYIK